MADNKYYHEKIFLKNNGFTLTELLVVVAILAILIIITMLAFKPLKLLSSSKDSQRETDLRKIAFALEEYSNGIKGPCYPDNIYDNGTLSPDYIKVVPKDPRTKDEYKYETFECNKYVIYAELESKNQDLVYTRNTSSELGGNFAVTSTNYRLYPSGVEEPPKSTTTPDIRQFYGCWNCNCMLIRKWVPPGGSPSYDNPNCSNMCKKEDPYTCINNYQFPDQF